MSLARKGSQKWNPSCDWPIRRKECSSDVSSRSFGGALRDIQKTAARETSLFVFRKRFVFYWFTLQVSLGDKSGGV